MKNSFTRYIAALTLFCSNGIVARHIRLEGTQIFCSESLLEA